MEKEREVLNAFYESLNGDSWKNNENWNSDKSVDEWYGVQTDKIGRIIQLNLEQNALLGEIPPGLGSLEGLTSLKLGNGRGDKGEDSRNRLTGDIPPELGNLSSLMILDLGWNQLTGGIPQEIGNLSNLIVLSLYNNRLNGKIPVELGSLSSLSSLLLHQN